MAPIAQMNSCLGFPGNRSWISFMRLSRSLAASLLLIAGGLTAASAVGVHVAPTGDDAHDGLGAATPLRTLAAALQSDAVRRNPGGTTIWLHGGVYEDVAVELGPAHSGLTIQAAPGAKPILLGGRRVQSWEREGDTLWSAPWPIVDGVTSVAPRLLIVNGRLCPRARLPEQDAFAHATSFAVSWMSSTGGGWKRKPTVEELTTLRYKPGLLPAHLDIRNAEVTVFHKWDESCVGLESHDPAAGVLRFSSKSGHAPGAFGVKQFVIWNTREGLTRPGQWYHDRSRGRLVYWPLPGEAMDGVEAFAPTSTTILRLEGSPQAKLWGVTVAGIEFSVTTVPLMAAGFAAEAFDGAISLHNTEDCRLRKLTVRGVAGHGIRAHSSSQRNFVSTTTVENCEIAECGAGGICVGGFRARIHNNHVQGIGRFYPSAVGIYQGGWECVVSHSEVHDTSYSAINYGGKTNRIEFNVIYDCMKVLHDGAAIYLFAGDGCLLRGNVARDLADRGGGPISAYYLDERSTGCVVEENLALRVSWPVHNHMATNNVIRRNVFISAGDMKLTWPRSREFTVAENILRAAGRIQFQRVEGVTNWSRNIFHSEAGRIEQVELRDNSPARTLEGAPGEPVLDDPQFDDWRNGDFRFRPGSPALELGLPVPDFSRAGRLLPRPPFKHIKNKTCSIKSALHQTSSAR